MDRLSIPSCWLDIQGEITVDSWYGWCCPRCRLGAILSVCTINRTYFWVGSVRYISCTTPQNGKLESKLSTVLYIAICPTCQIKRLEGACRRMIGVSPSTYCTVLHCTVLYCTTAVLYCTVLYCTVLYCTVLYCAVLCCTVLYCNVPYCVVLYGVVLYGVVLYCVVLYCDLALCSIDSTLFRRAKPTHYIWVWNDNLCFYVCRLGAPGMSGNSTASMACRQYLVYCCSTIMFCYYCGICCVCHPIMCCMNVQHYWYNFANIHAWLIESSMF